MNSFFRKNTELLAPAGSFESLMAAIQGHADAVYFGIGRLNMRSHSAFNFTLNDLPQIIDICRAHHIKAYLTLNTVLYDDDLEEMKTMIDAAHEAGVDALVLSDQAALLYAHQKNMEIHLSTQVNISNYEALKFYASYADVVVLARELSLPQIKNIALRIRQDRLCGPSGQPIRIEVFAHGALCMAISGKCYLSLHEYNHSANRGECLQLCRRSYTVTDNETNTQLVIDNEYIMSPKDLCTIGFLDRLLDAGIQILKIEGRARPPEYVKTVCECYHQALCSIEEGKYTPQLVEQLTKKLSTVFNRGFWGGYYLGRKLGEWSHTYGSQATRRKTYLGKVLNYYSKLQVGEFLLETGTLATGDHILITGPSSGVIELTVEEIHNENKEPVSMVTKGQRFAIKTGQQVRRSDKLFRVDEVPPSSMD